jgi:hypothetical protein
LPGPLPAGSYAVSIEYYAENPAQLTFATALVWRSDAGSDDRLYATTVPTTFSDAGTALIVFGTSLPAVPAHCGDLLVLQVTPLANPDAGYLVSVAFPTMTIP